MSLTVLAAAAHPDDIEFMMAGTLMLLKERGARVHYLNIASGSCGSDSLPADEISRIRLGEARKAADFLGARFHPPLVPDIEIYYERALLRRLAALYRRINPDIVLLQSPNDYMEDHMNSVRLMVTAAFCRSMRNFETDPPVPPVTRQVAIYHALPYGLKGYLREEILPHFYVDISAVMEQKRQMLAFHASQGAWLDASQGLSSYIETMQAMSAEVGKLTGAFSYAEGWRRHSHLGFAPEDYDPLRQLIPEHLILEGGSLL